MLCMQWQVQRVQAELREAERQRRAARDAKAKAAQSGQKTVVPAPSTPTLISPDGQPARRTLVICPLAVVST